MDLFIEKLVLKFGRNRSRNNEVITISKHLLKKQRMFEILAKFEIFLDFRKRILQSTMRKIEWRLDTPTKSDVGCWDLRGGGRGDLN